MSVKTPKKKIHQQEENVKIDAIIEYLKKTKSKEKRNDHKNDVSVKNIQKSMLKTQQKVDSQYNRNLNFQLMHGKNTLLNNNANSMFSNDLDNILQALENGKSLCNEIKSVLVKPVDSNDIDPTKNQSVNNQLIAYDTSADDPLIKQAVFLAFDSNGTCLGKVDHPICLETTNFPRNKPISLESSLDVVNLKEQKDSNELTDKDDDSDDFKKLLTTIENSKNKVVSSSSSLSSHSVIENSVDDQNIAKKSIPEPQNFETIKKSNISIDNIPKYADHPQKSLNLSSNSQLDGFSNLSIKSDSFEIDKRDIPIKKRTNNRKTRFLDAKEVKIAVPKFDENVEDINMNGLSLSYMALGPYGDTDWTTIEKNLYKLSSQAACSEKLTAKYVNDFIYTEDDDKDKIKIGINAPKVKGMLGYPAYGNSRLSRMHRWNDKQNRTNLLKYFKKHHNNYLSTADLAYYFSESDPQEQLDILHLLLVCRKLEKTLEDQSDVIDMLQKDLEQLRSTTFRVPNELTPDQFINLLDLDSPVPNDYFQLPECTASFYSRLYSDTSNLVSRSATRNAEQRLRESHNLSNSRSFHHPQLTNKFSSSNRVSDKSTVKLDNKKTDIINSKKVYEKSSLPQTTSQQTMKDQSKLSTTTKKVEVKMKNENVEKNLPKNSVINKSSSDDIVKKNNLLKNNSVDSAKSKDLAKPALKSLITSDKSSSTPPKPTTSLPKTSTSPSKPSSTLSKPSTSPSKPLTTSSKPLTTPSKPLTTPSKPLTTPSKPLTTPSKPLTTSSKDLTTPSKLSKAPTKSLSTVPESSSTLSKPPVSTPKVSSTIPNASSVPSKLSSELSKPSASPSKPTVTNTTMSAKPDGVSIKTEILNKPNISVPKKFDEPKKESINLKSVGVKPNTISDKTEEKAANLNKNYEKLANLSIKSTSKFPLKQTELSKQVTTKKITVDSIEKPDFNLESPEGSPASVNKSKIVLKPLSTTSLKINIKSLTAQQPLESDARLSGKNTQLADKKPTLIKKIGLKDTANLMEPKKNVVLEKSNPILTKTLITKTESKIIDTKSNNLVKAPIGETVKVVSKVISKLAKPMLG